MGSTRRFDRWTRATAYAAWLLATACHADIPQVDVPFEVRIGADEAVCGATYEAVGTTSSTVQLMDLRAYISGLTIDGAGAIVDEDPWQTAGVALLDFEDRSGRCEGNTDTRAVVRVAAPSDRGTIEFDLGVPEATNHLDYATLASPLNVSSMFWGWTGGYRFLKVDLSTTGQPTGWFVHIGSSGCTGVAGEGAVCTAQNRLHVSLDGWTPDKTVVLDLLPMLAAANVDVNTDNTGPGCMSEPDDPECVSVFAALGLPLGDSVATGQTVFSLE